mmetsp:Transcript_30148/g.69898  ORF Transcript_30148/g.69898 Transcript_30148/m.69898 type:complete len:331 (+) Transcript_30148:1297-2289(+)
MAFGHMDARHPLPGVGIDLHPETRRAVAAVQTPLPGEVPINGSCSEASDSAGGHTKDGRRREQRRAQSCATGANPAKGPAQHRRHEARFRRRRPHVVPPPFAAEPPPLCLLPQRRRGHRSGGDLVATAVQLLLHHLEEGRVPHGGAQRLHAHRALLGGLEVAHVPRRSDDPSGARALLLPPLPRRREPRRHDAAELAGTGRVELRVELRCDPGDDAHQQPVATFGAPARQRHGVSRNRTAADGARTHWLSKDVLAIQKAARHVLQRTLPEGGDLGAQLFREQDRHRHWATCGCDFIPSVAKERFGVRHEIRRHAMIRDTWSAARSQVKMT